MKSSTSRSNVLVLGSNAVYSLLPSTLIAQVEALLDAHRIEDAVDMADQQRRKVEAQLTVDEEEVRKLLFSITSCSSWLCVLSLSHDMSYRLMNFAMSINE